MNIYRIVTFILLGNVCLPAAEQESRSIKAGDLVVGWRPRVMSVNEEARLEESISSHKSSEGAAGANSMNSTSRNATKPLNIFVLVGNSAVNSIHSGSAGPLVLEVRNSQNLPLEGAAVVLQVPRVGASGFFPGQQLTWTGVTDANGQIVVSHFTPNQETGRFNIHIAASYAGSLGHAVIAQTNAVRAVGRNTPLQPKRSRWWKVAAVAGTGASGGIVWALHGSGDRPSVVLQPGPIAIGTPR